MDYVKDIKKYTYLMDTLYNKYYVNFFYKNQKQKSKYKYISKDDNIIDHFQKRIDIHKYKNAYLLIPTLYLDNTNFPSLNIQLINNIDKFSELSKFFDKKINKHNIIFLDNNTSELIKSIFFDTFPKLFIIEFDINIPLDIHLLYFISLHYEDVILKYSIFGNNGNYYIIFNHRIKKINENDINIYKKNNFYVHFDFINGNFLNFIEKCKERRKIIDIYDELYVYLSKIFNSYNNQHQKIINIILKYIYIKSMYYAINDTKYNIEKKEIEKIYDANEIKKFKYIWFPLHKYNIDDAKIEYVNSSFYSTTFWTDAEHISHLISKEVKNNTKKLIITDATSNIGGNTLNFSYIFNKVNAVEIDKATYNALINNMKVFGRNNIIFYNKNYNDIYKDIKQDILFIDPPWGGSGYKYYNNLSIILSGGINLHDLLLKVISDTNTKIIVMKLPHNFNLSDINFFGLYTKIIIHKIYNYLLVILIL